MGLYWENLLVFVTGWRRRCNPILLAGHVLYIDVGAWHQLAPDKRVIDVGATIQVMSDRQ